MCVRLIEGGADVPEEMRAFKNKLDAFEFHNNQWKEKKTGKKTQNFGRQPKIKNNHTLR